VENASYQTKEARNHPKIKVFFSELKSNGNIFILHPAN